MASRALSHRQCRPHDLQERGQGRWSASTASSSASAADEIATAIASRARRPSRPPAPFRATPLPVPRAEGHRWSPRAGRPGALGRHLGPSAVAGAASVSTMEPGSPCRWETGAPPQGVGSATATSWAGGGHRSLTGEEPPGERHGIADRPGGRWVHLDQRRRFLDARSRANRLLPLTSANSKPVSSCRRRPPSEGQDGRRPRRHRVWTGACWRQAPSVPHAALPSGRMRRRRRA